MKIFAIIVAFTLFLKPVFPVIDYVVNYDYLSKELCVNKDKPLAHCNGKCHLMKELAKEAENNKSVVPNKKGGSVETETLFCMLTPNFEMHTDCCLPFFKTPIHYANHYDYHALHSVFHPPTV